MDQTKMTEPTLVQEANARAETEPVRQSIRRVFHDVVTLAGLHGQLLRSDVQEINEHIWGPITVFVVGSLLLVATLPIALLAIIQALAAAGLSETAAFGAVAVISLAIAAGMMAWAWQRLRAMPPAFARSREELAQNINLISNAATPQAGLTPANGPGDQTSENPHA
jgi:hypothetical protein